MGRGISPSAIIEMAQGPKAINVRRDAPRPNSVAMRAHPDTDPLTHLIAACSSRTEQLSLQDQSGSSRYMLGFSYLPQVSTPNSFWRGRILAITFSVSLVEPHQRWSSAASFNRPAG